MTGPPAEPTESAAASASSKSSLPFGLSIETLQQLAAISALGSFVFVIAATISAAAYLSAWSIPPDVVVLNPLTALTKAGELIYTFIIVGFIWAVLAASHNRTKHHRGLMAGMLIVVAVLLVGLSWDGLSRGYVGATIAAVATYVLFIGARILGRIPLGPTVLVFVIVVFASAYQTGNELGQHRQISSGPGQLLLTIKSPIAGLPGGTLVGPSYEYGHLYLIFQDDQYLYVGSTLAPTNAYLIGLGQIVAITRVQQ